MRVLSHLVFGLFIRLINFLACLRFGGSDMRLFFFSQGYRGTNCESSMAVCDGGLICYNGGSCIDGPGGEQTCMCPRNFNGKGCIYYIPGEPAGRGVNNVTGPNRIGTLKFVCC